MLVRIIDYRFEKYGLKTHNLFSINLKEIICSTGKNVMQLHR